MKKVYVKPVLIFEDFTLNTNIAGDCDRIAGSPSKGTCGISGSAPGLDLFSVGIISGCVINGNDDESCYHVPTAATNLFNS